ncbi:MAG: DNA primase, partial [Ignavibacteria bacterium]
ISQNEFKDRFRGRLMIPIISESGKVVGFGGRKLFEDNDEAKYINSPETRIYNKSKILFGLNFAKNRIKEKGYALLVEGYMDLISLFQNRIENVVASSGTSLSSLQVKILSRYTNEVIIDFDADTAGQNAARRGIEIILENDLNISIVELPKGEDPDTYIRTNGKDKFDRLVEGRKSVINYISNRYKEEHKLDTPEGKTEFVREIISLISKMKDPIKRDFYVKDISERFSIYESILRSELNNYIKLKNMSLTQKTDLQKSNVNLEQSSGKISNAESMLIRLLLESDKNAKEYLIDNLEIDFIINPHIAKITNYIFQNYNNPNKIKPSSLLTHFEDPLLKNIISRSAVDESTYADIGKSNGTDSLSLAMWVVSELKLQNINKEIVSLQNKIKTDEHYSISRLEQMKKLIEEKDALKKLKEGLFKKINK